MYKGVRVRARYRWSNIPFIIVLYEESSDAVNDADDEWTRCMHVHQKVLVHSVLYIGVRISMDVRLDKALDHGPEFVEWTYQNHE